MDNNNNTANGIALDPNQMAPQDSSPLVQTGSTQPAVLDITPKDTSVVDPLVAPVAPVAPMQPMAPVTPLVEVTPNPSIPAAPSQVVDITPQTASEPLVATPIATSPVAPQVQESVLPPIPVGSLADIISSTAPVSAPQVEVAPPAQESLATPVAPTPMSDTPAPVASPVAETNPLAEDPNAVNTIG